MMSYYYGRKLYEIVAWAYEADIHCNECAERRFACARVSDSGRELEGIDSEGNEIHPVFVSDLSEFDYTPVCGDCLEKIS